MMRRYFFKNIFIQAQRCTTLGPQAYHADLLHGGWFIMHHESHTHICIYT